jgi:DNA-binding IclR family transcriptional regulator
MHAVDELEKATGEMVWVITHENGKAMYIYGRGGQNDIYTNTIMGMRAYNNCNSGGKAIIAHLPEGEIDEIVDRHGLPARTENTITSREALFDELAQIREQRYTLNRSEDLTGIHAIGIPLMFEGEI